MIDGTTVTITRYPMNAEGPVEIPAEIDGKPVTSIAERAFEGCWGMTSATIPPSVTSIGNYAFAECPNVNSVTIAAGVTSIGDWLRSTVAWA